MRTITLYLLLGCLLAIGGLWFLNSRLSAQVEDLELELSVLRDNLQVAEARLQIQEEQTQAAVERLRELDRKRQEAEQRVNRLRNLFGDHDLGKLIKRKPGLITTRIQKATEAYWREVQDATTTP